MVVDFSCVPAALLQLLPGRLAPSAGRRAAQPWRRGLHRPGSRRSRYFCHSLSLVPAQLVQIVPGVQPGVVAVGEHQLHRIGADRLDRVDAPPRACRPAGLPGPARARAPPPTANTRAGTRRAAKHLAVGESDLEDARGLVQLDLGRDGVLMACLLPRHGVRSEGPDDNRARPGARTAAVAASMHALSRYGNIAFIRSRDAQ